jgi:hypothetical protein
MRSFAVSKILVVIENFFPHNEFLKLLVKFSAVTPVFFFITPTLDFVLFSLIFLIMLICFTKIVVDLDLE